jgi:amidohydrolase
VTGAVDPADLTGIYRDLHAHPELAFAEHRTAGIVAARLRDLGYQTTTGVGRTGVVGVLANGAGPTVLLRADMDALPVLERTGLDYASTVRATGADGKDVPVMHACGHDAHVTCLLGAAAVLAGDTSNWSGTLLLVFQPAEEVGEGAQAMIDDGLFDRFGVPDVVLGQHVAPLPAGLLGVTSGPAFAAADSLRVVLHGQGGHGSRPESAVDPVLMAAATVQRLHAIVSRELPAADAAVVTVGALHAGTAPNVISDQAELLLSVRSFNQTVRGKVLKAIERIVAAEAAASGAPAAPEITSLGTFPVVVNDAAACARVSDAFAAGIGPGLVLDPGPVTGSEDVGLLATASGAPCAYWLLGSADPALFAGVTSLAGAKAIVDTLPSNHSPLFAPVLDPTLGIGIAALSSAARAWLAPSA